eukprot:201911_1
MSDVGGGQTIVPVQEESIRLEFYWGKSCCKHKYPRWQPVDVSRLLSDNGFTNEMLSHELKLINDQVNEYYGGCMRCFVTFYTVLLLLGLGAIAAQFALPKYRQNVLDLIESIRSGDGQPMDDIVNDFFLKYIFLIGGIVAIIFFLIFMLIHHKCCSTLKYKKSMQELKQYIYGFDLQNKYQLVKWVVKHTIDGVQFDIIVTPLQRENQLTAAKPEIALSAMDI